MSEENVEIVMRANAALNSGDVDGALEVFAPDAELRDFANAPDQASVVEGINAIRDAMTLWIAAFDELRADIKETLDTGEAVISDVHWQGQGKASGVSVDVRQFDLYELRERRVIRATLGFRSKEEALEAAGLSE